MGKRTVVRRDNVIYIVYNRLTKGERQEEFPFLFAMPHTIIIKIIIVYKTEMRAWH